ncbi:exodeoxyribonuclease VII small subunit [Sediminivirga luteola]|uniref:exodeoxyribonuclease VII small subunit n=1 Tax=Sediminivirga luteola TaxID=1774748 RepID=UPI001F5946AD|nr:exodeoxyribonuclease VII small subunit [Sediminivirga luteola]MCI2265648.1 exodeoxyribonuclease VII small subunit [Sediminivirga luteola]
MSETSGDSAPSGAATAGAEGTEIAGLSYEEAREQLVLTVQQLESGGLSLEESIALWERGEALADQCEAKLEGARRKLEQARARREDKAATEDASP